MKFKFEVGDLFKLPNILCYIRIILVPVFLYVYFMADQQSDYYIATAVVLASGITDFCDGQIARRCNMITDLGRIIDPVADKLMQLAMVVALTLKIKYMWLLVLYLILKEVVTSVTGLYVIKKCERRLNGAKWYGKVCTALLYVVMLVLVAFPNIDTKVQNTLLIVCAGGLTLAFVMYMRLYMIMINDARYNRNQKVLY